MTSKALLRGTQRLPCHANAFQKADPSGFLAVELDLRSTLRCHRKDSGSF